MKLVNVSPAYTTDTGTGSLLDAAGDIATLDVRHLTRVEVFVNQVNDAGTCTIDVERTIDGTNWDPIAQLTEASFPAGANMSQSVALVDSNGMPIFAKQIRVKLTAVAGGGTYTVTGFGATLEPGEKIVFLDPTYTTDPGASGTINAANDACTFDVRHLTEVEVFLDQITDAGTVVLIVERTVDGTNWDEVASKAETDLTAGANISTPVSFSTTGGAPIHAQQVRVRASALAAGGVYNAHVVGKQIPGYR